MTWNRKPVSHEEKGDRILSMPSEDRGLSGARDTTLPATLLARLQGHCKLLAGREQISSSVPKLGSP